MANEKPPREPTMALGFRCPISVKEKFERYVESAGWRSADVQERFVNSFIELYEKSGGRPKWDTLRVTDAEKVKSGDGATSSLDSLDDAQVAKIAAKLFEMLDSKTREDSSGQRRRETRPTSSGRH